MNILQSQNSASLACPQGVEIKHKEVIPHSTSSSQALQKLATNSQKTRPDKTNPAFERLRTSLSTTLPPELLNIVGDYVEPLVDQIKNLALELLSQGKQQTKDIPEELHQKAKDYAPYTQGMQLDFSDKRMRFYVNDTEISDKIKKLIETVIGLLPGVIFNVTEKLSHITLYGPAGGSNRQVCISSTKWWELQQNSTVIRRAIRINNNPEKKLSDGFYDILID